MIILLLCELQVYPYYIGDSSGFDPLSAAPNMVEDTQNSYRLIWIIIDRLSPELLYKANTPNINILQEKGAFGLLNVRTAGHLNSESTYLSANAGNRCQGSKMSHNAISYGKGAKNPGIDQLTALNKELSYQARPGLLGDLARLNDITIGVLGNSDLDDQERRTIVSMTMDSSGNVPYAEIDKDILETVQKPWVYQTDYSKLENNFLDYSNMVDTLFIETGDISRIDYYQNSNLNFDIDLHNSDFPDGISNQQQIGIENINRQIPDNWSFKHKNSENSFISDKNKCVQSKYIYCEQEKIAALERIDRFIAYILESIDLEYTQIGIIVPTPAEGDIARGKRLGWVLLAGRGVGMGWLSSSSTRRKGIITISDLLPTFLAANSVDELNSKLDYLDGNPIYSIPDIERPDWHDLISLNNWISFIYNIRSPFIKIFILFQIIVIIMAISSTVWKKLKHLYIFQSLFEYLLLAILLVPINYMLLSLFNIVSISINLYILLFLFIIEETILLKYIGNRFNRILYIAITLVLMVIFNLLHNYIMLADSILGYSSIIGARYYGIGNEYMGFFLGAYVMVVLIYLERLSYDYPHHSILFVFFPVVYLIGAGNLGANFGGMITALITVGTTTYYIYAKNKTINRFGNKFTIILLAAGFLLTMIFLDYTGIFGERSHIGHAVQRLLNQDWEWISDTIFRKFSMNLKLLRWTIWTRVLLVMIIYLFILLKKPVPGLKSFFEENHFIKAGFYGILAGCLITMFVNDSGVVAAATLLFYPVMSLLYLMK